MRKIYLFAVLFLAFQVVVAAQERTVITLVDAITGMTVSGATAKSDIETGVSNDKGQLGITTFEGQLLITHPGYQGVELTFADLERTGFVIKLEPRIFSDTVIITAASKREQALADTAAKIEQLNQDKINMDNPQTAADLLDTSDSVYIQKSQMGGGSPMIRGFSTNRVLIVMDGIRMNNAIFRSGNLHNVISIDPHMVDNTEVVYGPGSVIYGSDAIGGVMTFNTQMPAFTQEGIRSQGFLFSRVHSANSEFTSSARVDLAGRKWSAVFGATNSHYGDLVMGSNERSDYRRMEYVIPEPGNDRIVDNSNPDKQRFTGYDQHNFTGKFSLQVSDDLLASAGWMYSKTSDIPRYDRLIETRNGNLRNAEWYYGPQLWHVGWLRLDYSHRSMLFDSARITVSAQQFEESRHDRKLGSDERRNRFEKVDAYGFNIDFDRNIGSKVDLFYGFEYLKNDIGSQGYSNDVVTGFQEPISTRYPDGSSWESLSGYFSAIYRLTPELTFNAGVRYTDISISGKLDLTFFPFPFQRIDLKTSALNGSVGMSYALSSDAMLFANIGTGFRAPNIDDVAKVFDSEPGSVVVPNPVLESEYVITGDLGLIYLLSGDGRFTINAFYSSLQDAMVRRDSSFAGQEYIVYDGEISRVQQIINADRASVSGIEASIKISLNQWLSTRAAINVMQGETETGEPLRHVPPTFGNFAVMARHGDWLTTLNLEFNDEIPAENLAPSESEKLYMYALDAEGRPYSPAWWLLNLRSSWQIAEDFNIYIGLENLLDKRYRPYSSGIAGAGRSIYFAMKRSF